MNVMHESALLQNYLLVGAALFSHRPGRFLEPAQHDRDVPLRRDDAAGRVGQPGGLGPLAQRLGRPDAGDLHSHRGGLRGGHRLGARSDAVPAPRRRWTSPPGTICAKTICRPMSITSCRKSSEPQPQWPQLTPAGIEPEIDEEEITHRSTCNTRDEVRGRVQRTTDHGRRTRLNAQPNRLTADAHPGLPAGGVSAAGVFRPGVRQVSHLPVVLAFAASFALSVMLLFQVQSEIKNPPAEGSARSIGYEHICTLWTWASVQNAYAQRAAPRAPAAIEPSRSFDITCRCGPIR